MNTEMKEHEGLKKLRLEMERQLEKQRFQNIIVEEAKLNTIVSSDLKEKVYVIGAGQCGSNIAKPFNDNGFSTIIINSSEQDLKIFNSIRKYHILNGEGVGKERKVAKELLKRDGKNTSAFIDKDIKGKEIILICVGIGGGTGSAISIEIAKKLIYDNDNLIVCFAIAIPNDTECFQAKLNAYEFFQELNEIKGIGTTFIINNNKSDSYTYLNSTFYNLFLDLITLTDYQSENGNIDTAELKKMLLSRDSTLISSLDCVDGLDSSDIFCDIKEHSVFTLENDKKLQYIAISTPGQKDIDIKKILKDVKKEFGEFPKSIFQGYNDKDKVVVVLSGLTLPKNYIDAYREEVKSNFDDVKVNFAKREKLEKINISFEDIDEDGDDDDDYKDDLDIDDFWK